MTRPTLVDFNPRAQAQIAAQLYATPHPRTISVERDEPAPVKPKRSRKDTPDASGYFVANGLPAPVREHRFHLVRRWRFDYAWPAEMVAVEVDGGVFTQGRHTRGAGVLKDNDKINTAQSLGWRVFRYTPQTVRSQAAIMHVRLALAAAKG